MKHTLPVIVTFMDIIALMYHVQFVMSVIVLQSTWFLLSTHALQDGSESTTDIYLMSEHFGSDHHRTQFTCVDIALKSVVGSSTDHNGFLFYFVEGRYGSLPWSPYDNTKEFSCAVCTK